MEQNWLFLLLLSAPLGVRTGYTRVLCLQTAFVLVLSLFAAATEKGRVALGVRFRFGFSDVYFFFSFLFLLSIFPSPFSFLSALELGHCCCYMGVLAMETESFGQDRLACLITLFFFSSLHRGRRCEYLLSLSLFFFFFLFDFIYLLSTD